MSSTTRSITANQPETLPTWDTFEALFFVGAGLFVGIVLGILFPSLWRTFRRRFRNSSHYAPGNLGGKLATKLKMLKAVDDEDEDVQISPHDKKNILSAPQYQNFIAIDEGFVRARYLYQIGKASEAIRIYIEILTHENVSKQETNRALFELSQVYFGVGLHVRAFETALELLSRKPASTDFFEHLLNICASHSSLEMINKVLAIYKGSANLPLRFSIAHIFCQLGETYLKNGSREKTIEIARAAVKWERSSARAMILLWKATSEELWQRTAHDTKMMWTALAADLEALGQINQNTRISPVAGAQHLSKIISQISAQKESLETYDIVKNEFLITLKNQTQERFKNEKNLWITLFHAVLLLRKSPILKESLLLTQILTLLTGNENYLSFIKEQSEAACLGYTSHHCDQCHAFFTSFAWKCTQCNLQETLSLIIIPPFLHI